MEIADVIRKELKEENLCDLENTSIKYQPSDKECACIPCVIHGYENAQPTEQECASIPCIIHDKDYQK